MRGALTLGLARLEARLEPASAAPVAVALSGGGDSTALLLIACRWAAKTGRRLVAFTVDHRLQAAGADWARHCAALCARLGVEHHTLAWTGPKPATGLPAAARAARHALLADAARAAGARVILLGHTADDLAEAAVMRDEGSSVPDPREWSPSPAWPQGRGRFLLRPLLAVRRAALRALLAEAGETWIEDPANADARFARARARQGLSQSVDVGLPAQARPTHNPFLNGPGASLVARTASAIEPSVLSTAVVCAGGGDRLPRRRTLELVMERLAAAQNFTHGFGGARIAGVDGAVSIYREAGEFSRAGPFAPQPLAVGEPFVWDGRYEITAQRRGLTVSPAFERIAKLPAVQRSVLRRIPEDIRPTLPLVRDGDVYGCPLLAHDPEISVRNLVFERFEAAIGIIPDEASIGRVAEATGKP